ncbi:hypothetical protein LJC60_04950 [Ruminococcaceae bacterium OttesenSCG-928-D13]|nr:hypothetical protein [Ruminococcaceae bacterium OttesenSCG-928-D13]
MKSHNRLPAAGLCLLIGCALLAGCSRSNSESRSIIMAAPPASTYRAEEDADSAENAPVPEDPAPSWQVASRNLGSVYTGTEAGCYTLLNHTDGSAELVFFDYEALTMSTPLRDEAAQNGATGSLPGIYGGATLAWADGLYLFNQRSTDGLMAGLGEEAQASVLRVDSEKGITASAVLPMNLSIRQSGIVLGDGGAHLYFIAEDNAPEEGVQDVLIELDCAAMEYAELYRFDIGYEHTIEGYWENGPLICATTALPATDDPSFNDIWSNRAYILYKHGLYSGSREVVMSWSQGLPTNVHNNMLYYFQPEDGNLYAQNADTGEAGVLASGLAPEDYIVAQIQPMLDGLVRLQFSTNQGRTIFNYTINPDTSEVGQPSTKDLGDNVSVLAEAPAFFLVRSGDKWVNKDLVDQSGSIPGTVGGTSGNFVSLPEYALIAKADYWAGNRQFTPVSDLIYGD